MDRRYPPEIVKLLDSVENARKRLRQEIERTRQLLRQIERQMEGSATAHIGVTYPGSH